ncbi:MAG TPA: hypothetical protein PK981_00490 [Accumulibacter sp.]|nr:hypothetical protein [Accumulibacter sp.]HNC16703.1 hypothetical protein [Accumulibacter sp.]HNG37510.1 hypothetical protein [Accumulibacter sp.]
MFHRGLTADFFPTTRTDGLTARPTPGADSAASFFLARVAAFFETIGQVLRARAAA